MNERSWCSEQQVTQAALLLLLRRPVGAGLRHFGMVPVFACTRPQLCC
jgi:hypothetical protein